MFVLRHGAVSALAGMALLLAGCGDTSMHDTWKSTKGLYYEYINRPASVDYDDKGDLEDSQVPLARNMQALDTELTRFERYMMNQDRPPSQAQVDDLLTRFRWVGGVAAVSAEGEMLAQQSVSIKQLDYAALLAIEPHHPRDLRAMVQMTDFGPEVLIAAPIYDSSEFKGLYIAHFDMRLLLEGVPNPGDLIILSPEGVIWPGVYGGGALAGEDWKEIVKSRTTGRVGEFYWLCRYFGGMPLIFAAPTQGNDMPTNPAQLDALRELGITVPEPASEEAAPAEDSAADVGEDE